MAQQGNPNWSLPIPALAQYNNITPGQGGLPTGPFPGRITGSQHIMPDPQKPGAVEFTVVCTEPGEYNGREVRITCWIPAQDSKPGVLGHWKNLVESVAPNALGSPQQLGPSSFQNKNVYFFSKAPAEGETRADGKTAYNEYTFITPAMYQKMKAAAQAMSGQNNAAPAAAGGTAFTPPPMQPGLGGAPQGFAGVPAPPQGQVPQQQVPQQLPQPAMGQPFAQPPQQPQMQGFAQQPGFAQPGAPQGFAGVPQPSTGTVPF